MTDYFSATVAYYFDSMYAKSKELSYKMIDKYPNDIFGYLWKFNSIRAVDTVKRDSAAAAAFELFTFSQKDSVKYKQNYINASMFMVDYYINYAKDAPKALEFINRVVAMEPANENNKKLQEQIKNAADKQGKPRGANDSRSGSGSTGTGRSQR
jgi:hypothetical protein